MSDSSGIRPAWRAPPTPPHRQGAVLAETRTDGARGRSERRTVPRDSVDGRATASGGVSQASADLGLAWTEAGRQDDGSGSSPDAQDGREDGRGEAAQPPTDLLDPRLSHVADTIAMVCRHEPAQCVWSARIPLDAELLPDTVLHLAYSPLVLSLRFETSDWQVRSLLQGQLPALEAQVRAWMPAGAEVFASL